MDAPNRTLEGIPTSGFAVNVILQQLYANGTDIDQMRERNAEIYHLFAEGMPKTAIGRKFGISARRVGQILEEVESSQHRS